MSRGSRLGWVLPPLVALLAACGEPTAQPRVVRLDAAGAIADEAALVALSQRFYGRFPDQFDMVVFFGTREMVPGYSFYLPVQNDTPGLGYEIDGSEFFDDSTLMGSGGRLQGVIWMGPDWIGSPDAEGPDSVLGVLAHETGHRFGAMLHYDAGGKSPATDLVGDPYHWSFFLDSGGSPLRGNDWVRVSEGVYEARPPARLTYSPLDRYLMGLLSAEDVGPITLLTQPRTMSGGSDDRFQPWSEAVRATTRVLAVPKTVTLDQIVAVHGPRHPGVGFDARTIRQVWVLVCPQDAAQEEPSSLVERLERLAPLWEAYFERATGTLGKVTVEYP